jgi:aminopeptidase YwaD
MRSSFTTMAYGMLLAIVLVYLLMAVNFQSWIDPMIILMALPGAITGVLWILWLTQTNVSVPALMGAIYPYPLIEDGDFDIPSAYCTDVTGEEIAALPGREFRLIIDAKRYPAKACNVVARKNPGAEKKIAICAHLDTRPATPGALDNGAGAVTLMLLAEMLKDYAGSTGLELVAINGEEHYSAGGELDYLRRYGGELDRVAFAVNMDGLGYVKGKTAFSLYECPDDVANSVRAAFRSRDTIVEGPQWYAGDHMIFVMSGRPAVAITSDQAQELCAEVIHTPGDTPDLVDGRKLVDVATALKKLIEKH